MTCAQARHPARMGLDTQIDRPTVRGECTGCIRPMHSRFLLFAGFLIAKQARLRRFLLLLAAVLCLAAILKYECRDHGSDPSSGLMGSGKIPGVLFVASDSDPAQGLRHVAIAGRSQ